MLYCTICLAIWIVGIFSEIKAWKIGQKYMESVPPINRFLSHGHWLKGMFTGYPHNSWRFPNPFWIAACHYPQLHGWYQYMGCWKLLGYHFCCNLYRKCKLTYWNPVIQWNSWLSRGKWSTNGGIFYFLTSCSIWVYQSVGVNGLVAVNVGP
jgi:hypothetical protein